MDIHVYLGNRNSVTTHLHSYDVNHFRKRTERLAFILEISLKFETKKSAEVDLWHHGIKISHHSPASLITKTHFERMSNPSVTQLFISEGKTNTSVVWWTLLFTHAQAEESSPMNRALCCQPRGTRGHGQSYPSLQQELCLWMTCCSCSCAWREPRFASWTWLKEFELIRRQRQALQMGIYSGVLTK